MSANDKISLSASEEATYRKLMATYRKLMATYPAKPLKAFWTAMRLKHSRGPSVALAVACNMDYCGLERRSTKADGGMDGDRIYFQGGATPLILAAQADRLDVMQGLVAAGADVNAQDDIGGYTALTVAVANENLAATQFLITAGANVHIKDHKLRSSLYLAVFVLQTTRAMKALIDAGVKLQSVDEEGHTVLHEAAQFGCVESADLFLSEGASVTAVDNKGNTPFHAVIPRLDEVTWHLLDAGADIDAQNKAGQTPLHLAASQDYLQCVAFLLSQGASAKVRDSKGKTPYNLTKDTEVGARIRELLSGKKGSMSRWLSQ